MKWLNPLDLILPLLANTFLGEKSGGAGIGLLLKLFFGWVPRISPSALWEVLKMSEELKFREKFAIVWKEEKMFFFYFGFFILTALVSLYMMGLMIYDFGYAFGLDSMKITNYHEDLRSWDHFWWILKGFGWGFLANIVIRLNFLFPERHKDESQSV